MFKFWQENRAMQARIGELEDALTSVRADLAKEKRIHDNTFKKLDHAVSDRERQRQQLHMQKQAADKLTEALASAKKETAELDERWIGEVMKKDEAIQNLIRERDDLQTTFEIAHKRNLELQTPNLETYMQKQAVELEPPLLTSIPNPPPLGRWRLIALSGRVVWISDAFKECPSPPHSTTWPARCDYKWRSLVDNGEQRQCQLQNGHPGDHVFQSDATMPLKPGDPAGSGPRN